MTKSELIDAVAARGELTKARAELVVNCVFDTIIAALLRDEGVEIRGFGSVTVRPYKPYEGRNPRTGAPVDVPAKRLPFFKVGKELRELVNGSRHLAITGDEQPRRRARDSQRPDTESRDDARTSNPPWGSLPKVDAARPGNGFSRGSSPAPAAPAVKPRGTEMAPGSLSRGSAAGKR